MAVEPVAGLLVVCLLGLAGQVLARLETGQATPGPGTGGAGGGLMSVRERLALTWPDGRASFEVDSTEGSGALLRLRVPR